jgi:hypothetical protein
VDLPPGRDVAQLFVLVATPVLAIRRSAGPPGLTNPGVRCYLNTLAQVMAPWQQLREQVSTENPGGLLGLLFAGIDAVEAGGGLPGDELVASIYRLEQGVELNSPAFRRRRAEFTPGSGRFAGEVMRDVADVLRYVFTGMEQHRFAPLFYLSHHQYLAGEWVQVGDDAADVGITLCFPNRAAPSGAFLFRELVANAVRAEDDAEGHYFWPAGRAPDVLVITFARFGNIGGRLFKRCEDVQDVPLALAVQGDDVSDVHVLGGYIVHQGETLEVGHYTACVC